MAAHNILNILLEWWLFHVFASAPSVTSHSINHWTCLHGYLWQPCLHPYQLSTATAGRLVRGSGVVGCGILGRAETWKYMDYSLSNIWNLSDSNGIRIHNNLVCKPTLNHLSKLARLTKWLIVCLWNKWLWSRIPLLTLRLSFILENY